MPHTVLIVDDEARVFTGLQRALHKEPYELLSAHSAEEALVLLQTRTVDVVLSDQDMPGMPGTVFLGRVRQEYPETIRLILTGKATREVVVHAITLGAVSHFFTKPCNSTALAGVIRRVLRQKDLLAEVLDLLRQHPEPYARLMEWCRIYSRIMHIQGSHSGESLEPADEPPLEDVLTYLYKVTKAILVVNMRRRAISSATLRAMEDMTLRLDVQSSVQYARGDRLLLLCAVPPQERYILPAHLQEVYYGRIMVQCQPPGGDTPRIETEGALAVGPVPAYPRRLPSSSTPRI